VNVQAYQERILILGGPDFSGADAGGRGDFILSNPIDEIDLYPDGKTKCKYRRNKNIFRCPKYGDLPIFEYVANVSGHLPPRSGG
jgi:hypothetical protein